MTEGHLFWKGKYRKKGHSFLKGSSQKLHLFCRCMCSEGHLFWKGRCKKKGIWGNISTEAENGHAFKYFLDVSSWDKMRKNFINPEGHSGARDSYKKHLTLNK